MKEKWFQIWGLSTLCLLVGLGSGCGGCDSEAYVRSTPAMIVTNTDTLTFGPIAVGSSETQNLVILNAGSAPLSIDPLAFEPSEGPFVAELLETSVSAASETIVPTSFFPLTAGEFQVELHLLTNASNTNEKVVLLKGTAFEGTICGPCDNPPESACADEENLLIYNYVGSCVDGSCLYESTLKPCEFGCDQELNVCRTPECTEDADCDDGRFCTGVETCDTEAGVCEFGDTPCGPQAPICDEELDLCMECRTSDDCNDATFCNGAEICSAEFTCMPGAPPCAGGTPICLEATEQCVACTQNNDCDDGSFCNGSEICDENGLCAAGGFPCTEARPFCDENSDQCGECLTDAQCNNGVYCDGEENCNDTLDCEAGQPPCGTLDEVCDEASQSCGECTEDAQCDDGLFCNGSESCSDDLICQAGAAPCDDPTPICDEDTDACWVCSLDTHCDDGLYCNGAETCDDAQMCVDGTSPCSGETPVCLESSDHCVECVVDEDCDIDETCNNYVCEAPLDCDNVGLTWKWSTDRENPDVSRVSCQNCNPYGASHAESRRTTFCNETLPILCIKVDDTPAPDNLSLSEAGKWAFGHIALTPPVQGCSLTSIAVANTICQEQFGQDWRMAEHHDGGWPGWDFWALGHINPDTYFWLHINNQAANCWNSSAP